MRLTIDIPKEFVSQYKDDKFSDSLQRLKEDVHLCAGNYEIEVVDMLIKTFKNAKEEDAPKSPTPPHPMWKPVEGEYYYMMMGSGIASEWIWHGDNDDGTCIRRYSIGNVFKTKEEVEFAAKRLKVLAEMREWSGKWDAPVILAYNMYSGEIGTQHSACICDGAIRFATVYDATECIKAVGKERIKKYYFMVPEDEK